MELRKTDGSHYPPGTLKSYFFCIGYHCKNSFGKSWLVFKDKEFSGARDSLDAAMKSSARNGYLLPKKRARSISMKEEDSLWENDAFEFDDLTKLLHTLIYFLGLHLSLRACKEHRDLEYGELSQLRLIKDDTTEYILYTERCSKNNMVGINRAHLEPKMTRIYANDLNPNRCIVKACKKYISHRPPSTKTTAFYLTPKLRPSNDIWYKDCPYGVHSIEKVVKNLMKKSTVHKSDNPFEIVSNTSLRRTCKMRLLDAGIPKELSQKKTGRISDRADQDYIETANRERRMSQVLYSRYPTNGKCFLFDRCKLNTIWIIDIFRYIYFIISYYSHYHLLTKIKKSF